MFYWLENRQLRQWGSSSSSYRQSITKDVEQLGIVLRYHALFHMNIGITVFAFLIRQLVLHEHASWMNIACVAGACACFTLFIFTKLHKIM
jgi:hypothetical protein